MTVIIGIDPWRFRREVGQGRSDALFPSVAFFLGLRALRSRSRGCTLDLRYPDLFSRRSGYCSVQMFVP